MKEQNNIEIAKLREYYKKTGLTIIGLNDSQGTNVNTTFFKKGLLDYLLESLKSEQVDAKVINAFSLMINKTEHIDYLLSNNLNVEEIKKSQIYSAIGAFEKVASDLKLPKVLGQIGNLYRLVYKMDSEDKNIFITDTLKAAEKPIVIYSSGVNNLMREVHNNPFSIVSDYKNKDTKPNFYYTLEKSEDPKTMIKVIDGIKRNFENIYSINEQADICALGAYLPKSLSVEEMNVFRELICIYNERLIELSREYGALFINTWSIGEEYNKGESNFHISSAGHNDLASKIISSLYDRKFISKDHNSVNLNTEFEVTSNGVKGMIKNLYKDYLKELNISDTKYYYPKEVSLSIVDEHSREMKVFQKIIKK